RHFRSSANSDENIRNSGRDGRGATQAWFWPLDLAGGRHFARKQMWAPTPGASTGSRGRGVEQDPEGRISKPAPQKKSRQLVGGGGGVAIHAIDRRGQLGAAVGGQSGIADLVEQGAIADAQGPSR